MAVLVIGVCSLVAGLIGLKFVEPLPPSVRAASRPMRLRFVGGMWTLVVCGAVAIAIGIAELALA